jgi:hypothetical protein
MRRSLAALALLGLFLPGTAVARSASRAWVTGPVVKLNATTIAVHGTVTLAVTTAVGAAKSTLDGKRTLTCDLEPRTAQLVRRFHVGNNVRITCDDLTLTNIVHV